MLSAFLGKLTRHISIDRWRQRTAAKRGGGEVAVALEELSECVAGLQNIELEYERKELMKAYTRFLKELPETERRVFLGRYWYMESIESIANKFGFSQSKVKMLLQRTRIKLRLRFEEEGYE